MVHQFRPTVPYAVLEPHELGFSVRHVQLDPVQLGLAFGELGLFTRNVARVLELVKRALDDVLGILLPTRLSHQVQYAVIRQLELGFERVALAARHVRELLFVNLLVQHQDARPAVVLTPAPRTSRHLGVLARLQRSHLNSVKL